MRNRQPVFCVPGKLAETEKDRNERYITVPAGKPILFAILNWLSVSKGDQEMIDECKARIDVVAREKLKFLITRDGEEETNRVDIAAIASRLRSDFFMLGKKRCLTEGYWVMIRPQSAWFAKGVDYTIRSYGSCSSGATQVGIDYHLFVR